RVLERTTAVALALNTIGFPVFADGCATRCPYSFPGPRALLGVSKCGSRRPAFTGLAQLARWATLGSLTGGEPPQHIHLADGPSILQLVILVEQPLIGRPAHARGLRRELPIFPGGALPHVVEAVRDPVRARGPDARSLTPAGVWAAGNLSPRG